MATGIRLDLPPTDKSQSPVTHCLLDVGSCRRCSKHRQCTHKYRDAAKVFAALPYVSRASTTDFCKQIASSCGGTCLSSCHNVFDHRTKGVCLEGRCCVSGGPCLCRCRCCCCLLAVAACVHAFCMAQSGLCQLCLCHGPYSMSIRPARQRLTEMGSCERTPMRRLGNIPKRALEVRSCRVPRHTHSSIVTTHTPSRQT
jgi:hypothetical protein